MNRRPIPPRGSTVFGRGSYAEAQRISAILRKETIGGAFMVVAAVVAIIWSNSPWAGSYFALRDFRMGYAAWDLELSLEAWAADGLLAVFFFLVGLELKREFVTGDLREISKSIVPITAAAGGVAVPAAIYVLINFSAPEALRGWAIPTATDIAFVVAVLAIIGSHLPSPLRIFLLTLAVVDDLIAITIIALFYTSDLHPMPLVLAMVPLGLYAFLTHKYRRFFGTRLPAAWLILLPLGTATWMLVHASGVHSTVAGVLLGFAVPVIEAPEGAGAKARRGLAESFEHRFRPISSIVAVPIFAFLSAGTAVGGWEGLTTALADPVALGIIFGLVVGKPAGILTTTWILTKATRARLDDSLKWVDIVGVSVLAGIGFTVSLLVAELSFGHGNIHRDHAIVGILCASVIAALLAAVVLSSRNRQYRLAAAEEKIDSDQDGIPDVYNRDRRT